MSSFVSGCLKMVFLPVILALCLLALLGAGVGYFWASRHLIQAEPLVAEDPKLGPIRNKLLEHELRPIREAILGKQAGQFNLKLTEQELGYLVTQNFPPRLGEGRVAFTFEEETLTMRVSRKWRGDKWINLEWQGEIKADQGDYTVRIDRMRLGSGDCPALALGQIGHLLEVILETDPSMARQSWRIPNFQIEHGRAKLTIETGPRKQ